MRIAIAEQFQYRAANYFYMIGMIAEPVVYLVVWTTVANQQGGAVEGITSGEFAAYYIVWTLVRNMNIVFTPFGWEERVREGKFSAQLLRPVHPIHWDLAYFAGWKVVVIVLWLPIALLPLAAVPSRRAHITPLGVIVFLDLDLGRLPDPVAQPVRLGMVTFWTTRVGPVFSLYFAAELLLSGRLVPQAAARLGAAAGRDPAVPVHVRVPDRGADRRPAARGAPRRPGDAGAVDRHRREPRAADVRDRDQALLRGGRLMRAFRLFWTFARVGALNELQYRANLAIQVVSR